MVEIYFFHLMPWPYLPDDFEQRYPSAWVTYSNGHYDPERGAALYDRYLDELEYVEKLGFDGVCVNEHHQNAYGLMPSPNLMAAVLARRTNRVKIAILGNGISLRENPLRVAEEVAMIDVMSRGRVISGFVRGIGAEYFSLSLNPTYSRERFHEAHDLIVRAWTEEGPFSWEGKHYRFRYVNVWPRPYQKPHPPIWIPSQGSAETIEWAAARRYPYVLVYSPLEVIKFRLDSYREAAERNGYRASPHQLGWMFPIYVAETDERAVEEGMVHMKWLFHKGLRMPQHFFFPPGYLTEASMKSVGSRKNFDEYTMEELMDKSVFILGSPATVAQRLEEHIRYLGCGIVAGLFQVGTMLHHQVMKSLELFAREVMPRLREIEL